MCSCQSNAVSICQWYAVLSRSENAVLSRSEKEFILIQSGVGFNPVESVRLSFADIIRFSWCMHDWIGFENSSVMWQDVSDDQVLANSFPSLTDSLYSILLHELSTRVVLQDKAISAWALILQNSSIFWGECS